MSENEPRWLQMLHTLRWPVVVVVLSLAMLFGVEL